MEYPILLGDRLSQAGPDRERHSKDLAPMTDATSAPGARNDAPDDQDDILYPSTVSFVLVHLACLAAIWTGITWQSVAICAALYWLRIFAIGAGYHRYFSHRAFSTSRVAQFVLAVLAQSTAQRSVLWWAA